MYWLSMLYVIHMQGVQVVHLLLKNVIALATDTA